MTTDKEKSLQAVLDKVVDSKKCLGHHLPLKDVDLARASGSNKTSPISLPVPQTVYRDHSEAKRRWQVKS